MKLITSMLRTGELSLSLYEGSTPIYLWHIADKKKVSQLVRTIKSQVEELVLRFPDKKGEIEITIEDRLINKFLTAMSSLQIPQQTVEPIWRSPSASSDFTALQRMLSRLQTAKPHAHGAEITIAGNVAAAPTGHDPQLLREYQIIKHDMEARGLVVKKKMKDMADDIIKAIAQNYVDDYKKEYGERPDDNTPMDIALATLSSEYLLTANDGPVILAYLHHVVTGETELPVGSYCMMVQTINDMVQKGKKSVHDVAFGQEPDYSCPDGLQTRLALLHRVIQTKTRIAGEASYVFATTEEIISVAKGLITENVTQLLLNTAKQHLSFIQDRWSCHLSGIISLLTHVVIVRANKSKFEYVSALQEAVDTYKLTTLKNPDTYDLGEQEAADFLQLLMPMIETFCEELESLFDSYMKADSFKATVTEQTRLFPPDVNAEGFLESTFLSLLTDPIAPLREMAGTADQKLLSTYKKEYQRVVADIIRRNSIKTSIFLADAKKIGLELSRREQVMKDMCKVIEERKVDYTTPEGVEQLTALFRHLYDKRDPSGDASASEHTATLK